MSAPGADGIQASVRNFLRPRPVATSVRSVAGVITTAVVGSLGCGSGWPAVPADGAATPDAAAVRDGGGTPEEFGLVFEPRLPIANTTLIIPLALDQPALRTLSAGATGDVLVAYTRVGCWADAPAVLGPNRGIAIRATPPVRLTSVAIAQVAGDNVTGSLDQLADQNCVSLRSPEGTWQPSLEPAMVSIDGDVVRLGFDAASALTDAVAIFLPTYTNVSRIDYRAAAAP